MELFDELIRTGLNPGGAQESRKAFRSATQEDWAEVCRLARSHGVVGTVSAALREAGLRDGAGPESALRSLAESQEAVVLQHYSMLSFTTYVMELLSRERVPFYVLKGFTLSALYPSPEMRTISDADLYIPDAAQFRRACAVLEHEGFEPEQSAWDYHKRYTRQLHGRQMLLELHIRPAGRMAACAGAEARAAALFERQPYAPDLYECDGASFPALPAELYGAQLLLHMMNHFISEQFSVSMLCDWTVFCRAKGRSLDPGRFGEILDTCGLAGFTRQITGICMRRLGLESACVPWMEGAQRDIPREDALYARFFSGEAAAGQTKAVNACLEPDCPLEVALAREVHRQMRYRFPRARKIVLIWPLLWAATIGIFFYNNRILGRGSVRGIVAAASGKNRILEELALTKRGKG